MQQSNQIWILFDFACATGISMSHLNGIWLKGDSRIAATGRKFNFNPKWLENDEITWKNDFAAISEGVKW